MSVFQPPIQATVLSKDGRLTTPWVAWVQSVYSGQRQTTVMSGGHVTINLVLGSYVYYNFGSDTAAIFDNPVGVVGIGQRLIFEVLAKTGINSTITWDTVYKTAAVTTVVTGSKKTIIEFIYNGINWIQVGTPIEVTP